MEKVNIQLVTQNKQNRNVTGEESHDIAIEMMWASESLTFSVTVL